ncbi:hypothetical protein GCM10023161_13260 [Mycobacterium paraffinicum]|uniref:Uncharacterized protein n=1 Tax=Mycobacterium paraffinicum TaxID=53378 RepID=A0ABP8RG02_9MYCO
MEVELKVRVVDRFLHNLAVDLEERHPAGLGLGNGLTEGALEGVTI